MGESGPQRVLFRVDAGSDVGLGHLNRCLALANALTEHGVRCFFLTSGSASSSGLATFDHAGTLDAAPAGSAEDMRQTLAAARRVASEAVVIDSYGVDEAFLTRLVRDGLFVVAIDDHARHAFPCQLVINGGVAASALPYRSVAGTTRFLLGPEYALLRPEFWALPARAVRPSVERVLVTLGGGDPRGLMPQLVEALDQVPGAFEVDLVIGPFFDNRRRVEEAARAARHSMTLRESPDRLHLLMMGADLAVSAGGQTLYELAAAGTPAVAVEVADNQSANIAGFVAAGVARTIGRAGDVDLAARLHAVVSTLLGSNEDRAAMAATGQRLVDARGARRIAEHWMGRIA